MPTMTTDERTWLLYYVSRSATYGVILVGIAHISVRLVDLLAGSSDPFAYRVVIGIAVPLVIAGVAMHVNHAFRVRFRSADPLEGQLPGYPMLGSTGRLSGTPEILIGHFREVARFATQLDESGRTSESRAVRLILHSPVDVPTLTRNLLLEIQSIEAAESDGEIQRRASTLVESLGAFIADEESRGEMKWRYGA